MSREFYRPHIRAKGTSNVNDIDYIEREDYILAQQFAAKYQTLKQKYRQLSRVSVSSPKLDLIGSRSTLPGSPVERAAIDLIRLSEDISIIEDIALIAANGDKLIQQALLDGAGAGRPYDVLYPVPPVGKSSYYRYRRRYYRLLSQYLSAVIDGEEGESYD